MIDIFKNLINSFKNTDNLNIKINCKTNGFYHKLYCTSGTKNAIKNHNIDGIINNINYCFDNIVDDYLVFKDVGCIYLKCKTIEFKYYLNSKELLEQFNSYDEYLEYFITNVANYSRAIYPCYYHDWSKFNVAVQDDLSWIVVDLEEFIDNVDYTFSKEKLISDVVRRIVYRSKNYKYDEQYVDKYIREYFAKNSHLLDFVPG